jgi:hypothetical protein
MRKVIFSLIGITAAFTFILNSSHATDTQKALSEEKIVQYAHYYTGG